ncbi:hypothetical protein [Pseudohongiella acticola]|uniref:hypothetical protein n=1 Tax=Pseudohongiella acticola TaxID=1524254 RepID=UPI0030EBC917|tara:strand:+ start:251 stop:565 length:315 start_codon:yes stop_codon:yes gene_type:complete
MATNRKRRSRANNAGFADKYCRQELLTGPCLLAGLGYFTYGAEDACDLERMKADWQRHKRELMAEWIADNPGTRPFAWWQFEASEPRLPAESDSEYLERLNALE